MKIYFIAFIIFLNTSLCISQTQIDSTYLEDQLYLTFSYDNLVTTPKGFENNGFSGGFSTGFIKDIPFNSERNFGLGIGLGYGYSAHIQNIVLENNISSVRFESINSYNTNWLKQHKLEVPIEIRFRGSSAEKYKFWRVYTGVKLSYVLLSKSKFINEEVAHNVNNSKSLERVQYGAILSAGYSTWNLYIYYGLKPIFNNVVIEGEKLKAKEFKIGLNFYIM